MTLFIDPSESREGTRLPQSVIDQSQELPGLESCTGADLLISTLRMPPLRAVDDSDLCKMNLKKHITNGLLVQRKTGRDLTSSIPKINEILLRMRQWSERPWLLFVGDIKVNHEGIAVVDGADTGFSYAALDGALSWWQLRGGYITQLPSDRCMASWINGMMDRLAKLQVDRTHYVFRPPQQYVVNVPAWVQALAAFPNIGPDRALALGEYSGTLARAIEYLSDGFPSEHVNGIGPATFKQAKTFLGLRPDEVLRVTIAEKEEEVAA